MRYKDMRYNVSIKVEGEEGFFHVSVYAPNEEKAKEYGLNKHLNEWGIHRGIAKVVRVSESEAPYYEH